MTPKAIMDDFHYFVGTSLFALFVLILVAAPVEGLTVASAAVRVGMSALALALSFYVLQSGRDARSGERLGHQPVVLRDEVRAAVLRKRASRAA